MPGFTVYCTDNVLVMLTATAASTLGANLFMGTSLPAWVIQGLGVLFNIALALVLYAAAANRFQAAKEASADAPTAAVLKDAKAAPAYQSTEGALEAGSSFRSLLADVEHDAASAYSHILEILPWIIIVPMVNIPISISNWLLKIYQSNPYGGDLFTAHFVMASLYLVAAVMSANVYAAQSDNGAKCESLPTFLLNSFNHALLSSAGKSLHLLECVIFGSVVGMENDADVQSRLTETTILLVFAWFLLAHCWPRLSEATPKDKLFKSVVTTITVYSWAYSFINNLWGFFYNEVKHGQIIYVAIMVCCLMVAFLLASYSEQNFYGGPSSFGKAFGLMLCWVIDFGFWWWWAQVMTDIDGAAVPDGAAVSTALVNSSILIALIAVTSMLYIYADLQTLALHRSQRQQHVPKVKTSVS